MFGDAMSVFPDPRYAPSDVVAMGEDLRVPVLREAYRKGIFPWPHDGLPLPWFSPKRRTLLFFDQLHIGRSLRRAMHRAPYTFTIDRDFPSVIRACALRSGRPTCSSSKKITARRRGENHGSGSPSCGHGKIPLRYASRSVSMRRSSPIATTSLGA